MKRLFTLVALCLIPTLAMSHACQPKDDGHPEYQDNQDNQEKQPRNIGTCVKFNEFFIQHYFLFMVEIEKISLEFFRIIFDGFISEFYKLLEIVMLHCRQQ